MKIVIFVSPAKRDHCEEKFQSKNLKNFSIHYLTSWRQFFMRLSCYWQRIRHKIVKVAVDPLGDSTEQTQIVRSRSLPYHITEL